MLAALLDHNVIQQMQVSQWNLGLGGQSTRSSAFGAFVGYNSQWDDVVVGLEVNYMHGKFGGASRATKELVSGSALSDGFFHDVAVEFIGIDFDFGHGDASGARRLRVGCFLPYMFAGIALGQSRHRTLGYRPRCCQRHDNRAFHATGDIERHGCLQNQLVYGYTAGLGVDVNAGRRPVHARGIGICPLHVRRSTPTSTRCAPASATNSDPAGARRSGAVDRFAAACCTVALTRARRMKIYGDTNSGNCLKVKWVCDHLALPYSWIAVDTLKGETRTAEFLKLNGAGQVPTVEFDDGRTLAQSNAIIRYLARGSGLIPPDAFAEGKMDEWLFWEQYSHEPYIAVCRFQMFYLGKPASDLDPDKVKRGYAALARMEHQLALTPFLVGDAVSLADVSLLAYTRVAHEGGFHLDGYAALRRWIGETEKSLGLPPAR